MRIVPLIALLLLLTGGLSGPAAAQLSQNNDDDAGPPRITFNRDPANYLEGELVHITTHGDFAVEPTHVEVRCLNCPEDHIVFSAKFRRQVYFPPDFNDAGPGQPMWNGTWRASVVSRAGTNSVTLLSETFNVWLTDIYTGEDRVLEPGEILKVRSTGFAPDTPVSLRIHRTLDTGEKELAWSDTTRATGAAGLARFAWFVPLSEAEYLNCARDENGRRPCRAYSLEVSPMEAAEKEAERQTIHLRPARITVNATSTPEAPMRTQTLEAEFKLEYSSGILARPDAFKSSDNPHGDIRVQLERVFVDAPGAERTVIAELDARFDRDRWRWTANWTIPRHLNLSATGDGETYRFRWAVPQQTDAHGNLIPYTAMDPFPIRRYRMDARVVDQPLELERLEDGRFVLNLSYADGTPFKPGANRTELSAVLEPLAPNGDPAPGGDRIRVIAEHEEGALWSFTHQYGKTYPDLGPWRLRFDGTPLGTQAQDRWGNYIPDNTSRTFTLTVAKPRIDLITIVNGELRNATRGLDRGDTVQVRVTTTYPDGAPINRSDLDYEDHREGLLVRVHQKGASGVEVRATEHRLREWRPFRGEWQGSLTLPTNRSGAPLGDWEFEVVVVDNATGTPNSNTSRFTRAVHPETLRVTTRSQPINRIPPTSQAAWTFRVRGASDGAPVDDTRAGTALRVNVHTWTGVDADAIVAQGLRPLWNPDRHAWTVVWSPPQGTPPGTYVFVVKGTDLQGNVVEPDAFSRPFRIYVDAEVRDAIIQPPLTIERGDEVVAAFNGAPDDRRMDGSLAVRVALERYSASQGAWVEAVYDVLDHNTTTANEYVGRWESDLTSPVGSYRFAIHGVNANHAPIIGHSRNFTLKPQNVTRDVLAPMVPFASKGTTVEALVERRTRETGGLDQYRDIRVVGLDDPGRLHVDLVENAFRVQWTIPLRTPPGQYVLRLKAVDVHGNPISADIGPVTVGSVNLTVEPLVSPPPTVPRGQPAEFVFRVFYPGNTLMTDKHGAPTATVLRRGAPFEAARVHFDGVNWHATWTPDPLANLTRYSFEVDGVDFAGNPITPRTGSDFRLEGGLLERNFTKEPKETIRRLDLLTARVPAGPSDEWVAFRLIHFGARHPGTAGDRQAQGEFVGAVAHEWNPSLGVYEVEWRPPKDARLGHYQLVMEGETANGNALEAKSVVFKVDPLLVSTQMLDRMGEFPLGETRAYRARIVYPDGSFMTPDDGEPTFRVLLNNRPVANAPTAEYDPDTGLWAATWAFPNALPPGSYTLKVSGTDSYGNRLAPSNAQPSTYEPSRVEQLTGATVPGFDAALMGLALAGVALALSRRPGARRP